MAHQNIALMGRARSGKDTVAARLVGHHNYSRVAFADVLKDMALSVNPRVAAGGGTLRLRLLIGAGGWEEAKSFPEVRGFLQDLGQSIRDVDPNFWLRLALDRVDSIAGPVVVTDVRYPNEYAALQRRGFRMVRVFRPNICQQFAGLHESETALDDYTSEILLNAGSLQDLETRADALI
jgi:hypothetical protein